MADFRVSALAQLCHISERELRNYIRWRFGTTPRQWLTKHRMSHAKRLLSLGKSSKETAYLLGFKQDSHFA